jgi:transcriptional regulator with XRE-family HTH domain
MAPPRPDDLALKIARLVEERGWNQEDFSRISDLNRHTVRKILHAKPERRLRNATVSACAEALGLTVHELRTLPLERLLPRMHGKPAVDEEAIRLLHARATLPELITWIQKNPERTMDLTCEEIHELLQCQEPGGRLSRLGVNDVICLMERKRAILTKVREILTTDSLGFLEEFVTLLHEKVTKASSASRLEPR